VNAFIIYAAFFLDLALLFIAFHTFSAVAGIETSVPIASMTAFITHGGDAIAPASPQPLTPKGFDVAGVHVYSILNSGKLSARGIV
jgi:hypothetical protein